MKLLRVFLKNCNNHYIDFPYGDNQQLQNALGFWKMEGVLYRDDPNFGVAAAVPYDAWAFCAVLVTDSPEKPGTSFDFRNPPRPN